jgi:hypothetical protein
MDSRIVKSMLLSALMILPGAGWAESGSSAEGLIAGISCETSLGAAEAATLEQFLASCQGECGRAQGQCLRACAQLPPAEAGPCRTICKQEHAACLAGCAADEPDSE